MQMESITDQRASTHCPFDGEQTGEDPESRENRFRRLLERGSSPPEVISPVPSYGSYGGNYSPPPVDHGDRDNVLIKVPGRIPMLNTQHLYTYMPIGPCEMRLMRLYPGQEDEPIYASLKTIDVTKLKNQRLHYQALSYSWGEDDPSNIIYLQDISVPQQTAEADEMMILMETQAKPRPFPVRTNLFNALKRLRSETYQIWLWIDVVCINQNDNDEKSRQLPIMVDIYNNAWNVTIWIGDNDDPEGNSDLAMDSLPSILNLTLLDRLVEGDNHDESTLRAWVAFAGLLKRSWFSRRWVIQEVAFARQASMRCGGKIVNWIDFADAVELFMRKLDRIRLLYDASELSRYDPDALNHVESAGAQAMVSTINSMLRKTETGLVLEHLWDLESLVTRFVSFDASDPRDTIYAFFSLAKDGARRLSPTETGGTPALGDAQPFLPQYRKDARQVYMEFVEHCVKTTESLDIICRHWALPIDKRAIPVRFETYATPSWVGMVTDSSFGPPSKFTGRINGDSLVGPPGQIAYNASRNTKAKVSFGRDRIEVCNSRNGPLPASNGEATGCNQSDTREAKRPRMSWVPSALVESVDGCLYAKGMILQKIERVSPRVVDGTISDDCLRILGWEADSEDKTIIADRIWKTLVADRGPDVKNAPLWYRRACTYALRKTSAEGDLNTAKLIANRSLPESVVEYLKRVQSIVWSRKFFSCKRHFEYERNALRESLVGIGSRKIEPGDLVCILFGCSVPVIMRPLNRNGYDGSRAVKLMGECYVYGKMDGEALAGMDEEGIDRMTVEFEIH